MTLPITYLDSLEINVLPELRSKDLTQHVSGPVETSNFDGCPVFNATQRWQLFDQGLMSNYECQLESERYATHQATPVKTNPDFQWDVRGVPF